MANFLSLAVTAVVIPGLFVTVALPSYAYHPESDTDASQAAEVVAQVKLGSVQGLSVDPRAVVPLVIRDTFAATSVAELQAAAVSSGPLANPPLPAFSLDAVVQTALQYQGVPYRFGGADPSGFDCSGFVMYVYAQFGVSLPHGSASQAAAGTPIALSAALPGDVVIMDGHDGFYMGNGMILDAPQEGEVVSVRPIWTDDYYIVRFGI